MVSEAFSPGTALLQLRGAPLPAWFSPLYPCDFFQKGFLESTTARFALIWTLLQVQGQCEASAGEHWEGKASFLCSGLLQGFGGQEQDNGCKCFVQRMKVEGHYSEDVKASTMRPGAKECP